MGCASFFFTTLEEYYIGGMFLGVGNAISEGSIPYIILFIVMGAIGNEWWVMEVYKNWRIADIAFIYIGL